MPIKQKSKPKMVSGVRWSNISLFVMIAHDSSDEYFNLLKKYKAYKKKLRSLDKDEQVAYMIDSGSFKRNDDIMRTGYSTIIFAAIAVESYIYDLGCRYLYDDFMREYLDRVRTKIKWAVVPHLVCGKPFPRDSKAFSYLEQLIRNRNDIVHHKTTEYKPGDEDKRRGSRERKWLTNAVRNAIRTIEELAIEMEDLIEGEGQNLEPVDI